MTIDERFEQIAHNFETVHDSLNRLATIASAHEDRLDAHGDRLDRIESAMDRLQASQERTEASIRAMADQLIATQREWEAYLRTIPRQ